MSNFIAQGDNINGQSVVIVEKFTPGPWHWLGGNAIWDSTNHLVSTTVVYKEDLKGYDESKCVQNAKLIAAAPDLYAACKEFVRKVEAGEAKTTTSYEQMKAAIKKATP